MKTQMSRFQIHDDLTAPEGSLPVLKGALQVGGQLPNFLGVLAGSPAALRAYARFRSELRHGTLTPPDARAHRARDRRPLRLQAGHRGAQRAPPGRRGWASTRSPARREWDSGDEREAALLRYLRPLVEQRGHAPMHLHEEAREAGWSDEQLLEAIAVADARVAHRDGQRRRRGAGRRLARGDARPPRRLIRDVRGARSRRATVATVEPRPRTRECCPYLHEAVELVGKRWTGAIVYVLLHGGPLRFSEICQSIPQLSDRLLSERMKELEARGIVERHVHPETPVRVELRAHRDGPRAGARARRAQGVGAALAPVAAMTRLQSDPMAVRRRSREGRARRFDRGP